MNVVRRLLVRNRQAWAVARDTLRGTVEDGFTHAGNIAYLSLVTLFPFFILIASVAGTLGRTEDGLRAVEAFLRTVPRDVAALIEKPITDVLQARASGGVLTFGVLVTLWTISGFVETLREIIRRAHKVPPAGSLWRTRLLAAAVAAGAVLLMLLALGSQVLLTGAETFVEQLLPVAQDVIHASGLPRLIPLAVLFAAIWAVFYVLTPLRFRRLGVDVWPGALVAALTWVGTTMLLPRAIGLFGGYALTYGSLAGVIVALLFFYIIGLGLVLGANLNAALAKQRLNGLRAAANETSGDSE